MATGVDNWNENNNERTDGRTRSSLMAATGGD